MLFFGFRRFSASLLTTGPRRVLLSPKAGAVENLLFPSAEPPWLPSLLDSVEIRGSFSGSLASLGSLELFSPSVFHLSRLLVVVLVLYSSGLTPSEFRETSESLTPLVGGAALVDNGFGFVTGASEGCGGGVASCRSSRRT